MSSKTSDHAQAKDIEFQMPDPCCLGSTSVDDVEILPKEVSSVSPGDDGQKTNDEMHGDDIAAKPPMLDVGIAMPALDKMPSGSKPDVMPLGSLDCNPSNRDSEGNLSILDKVLTRRLSTNDFSVLDPVKLSAELSSKNLLRGVPFRVLVDNAGAIFKAGKPGVVAGGADGSSYELSKPMHPGRTFAGFISHSWRGNGRMKFITLQHRRLWRPWTVLLAFLMSLLLAVLGAVPLLYIRILEGCTPDERRICHFEEGVPQEEAFRDERNRVLLNATISTQLILWALVIIGLLATTLWGHRCFRCPCRRSSSQDELYFLDKCTIHQTDIELKQLGVRHVGDFLATSDKMFILYDKTYFTRLWCVFELSLFMRYKSFNDVDFQPISLIPIAYALAITPALIWLFLLLRLFSETLVLLTTPLGVGAVVAVLSSLLFYGRRYKAAQQHMLSIVANFSAEDTQCFAPADKLDVMGFIEMMWANEKLSGVDAFNSFVRGCLHESLVKNTFRLSSAIIRLIAPSFVVGIMLAISTTLPSRLAQILHEKIFYSAGYGS